MHPGARPPELHVSSWLNAKAPLSLAGLLGRPVLVHAFHMLCPGCVAHAIPQAEKAHRMFRDTDLQVIGLHTVFEHHEALTPVALEAFVHEYRLTFPIGIDKPGTSSPLPVTMERYGMHGTPTTILIGRNGLIVTQKFGQIDDMALGAMIASALSPAGSVARPPADAHDDAFVAEDCAGGVCLSS